MFGLKVNSIGNPPSPAAAALLKAPGIGGGGGGGATDPDFDSVSLLMNAEGNTADDANWTDVVMLMNGESGVSDLSSTASAITVTGDTAVSTAQKKYGDYSIAFDGTGDEVSFASNAAYNMGTGDFTYEAWVYINSFAANVVFFYHANDSGVLGAGEFNFYVSPTVGLALYSNGAVICNQGSLTGWSTGTWYHVAMVRNGTSINLYRDGVSLASATSSIQIGTATIGQTIGADPFLGTRLNGYMDDIRITKGVARYTTAFTPPTEALPKRTTVSWACTSRLTILYLVRIGLTFSTQG